MIISIHQPEHLPWPGFFNKIKSVDQFVILDNVEYRKVYYHNRNKYIYSTINLMFINKIIKKYSVRSLFFFSIEQ